ncbi:MAG: hypothetical protein R3Y09_12225 [Clostridia bacterium]
MNLISCTDKCKFQIDGYCTLKDVTKVSNFANSTSSCIYFTPISSKNLQKNITVNKP